jgi:hypothetical protein
MELAKPNCFDRECKHFLGVATKENEEEENQILNCAAFPKGIPLEIAYGTNKHLVRHPDQDNDIVYERKKK